MAACGGSFEPRYIRGGIHFHEADSSACAAAASPDPGPPRGLPRIVRFDSRGAAPARAARAPGRGGPRRGLAAFRAGVDLRSAGERARGAPRGSPHPLARKAAPDEPDPLGEHTRLVASSGGPFPSCPSRLARGARAGKLDDAETYVHRIESGRLGRSAPIASWSGALFPGTTVVFRLRAPDYMRLLGHSPESLELQVHLPAAQGQANAREGPSRPEVAIAIQGLLPPRNEDMPPATDKEEPAEKKDEKAEKYRLPPRPEAPRSTSCPDPPRARSSSLMAASTPRSAGSRSSFPPRSRQRSEEAARWRPSSMRPAPEGDSDPDPRHAEAFAKCIADLSGSPAEAAPGNAEEFDLHDIGRPLGSSVSPHRGARRSSSWPRRAGRDSPPTR